MSQQTLPFRQSKKRYRGQLGCELIGMRIHAHEVTIDFDCAHGNINEQLTVADLILWASIYKRMMVRHVGTGSRTASCSLCRINGGGDQGS